MSFGSYSIEWAFEIPYTKVEAGTHSVMFIELDYLGLCVSEVAMACSTLLFVDFLLPHY